MFEKSSTLDHPIIPLYPHFVGDDIFLSHSTIIEWLNPNFCVFQSHFLMVSLLSAGDIGIIDPIVKCHSLPWKFMNTHQQIQMNSVKLSHPIQSHEKSPFKSQPPLNPIEIPLKSPWNHFISSPWNPMKSHEIPMKSHQNPANPNLQTQPPGFHPEGPRPRGGDLWTRPKALHGRAAGTPTGKFVDAAKMVEWWWKNGDFNGIPPYYTIITPLFKMTSLKILMVFLGLIPFSTIFYFVIMV